MDLFRRQSEYNRNATFQQSIKNCTTVASHSACMTDFGISGFLSSICQTLAFFFGGSSTTTGRQDGVLSKLSSSSGDSFMDMSYPEYPQIMHLNAGSTIRWNIAYQDKTVACPYIDRFLTLTSYLSPLSFFAFPIGASAFNPICVGSKSEKDVRGCIKIRLQNKNEGFVLIKHCIGNSCEAFEDSTSLAIIKIRDYMEKSKQGERIHIYFCEDFTGLYESRDIPPLTNGELTNLVDYYNLRGYFVSFSAYKWILDPESSKFIIEREHFGVSDSLVKAVREKNIHLITMSRNEGKGEKHSKIKDDQVVGGVFSNLERLLDVRNGRLNLIVFPESFFGNYDGKEVTPVIDVRDVVGYIGKFAALTKDRPNVLLSLNFMHMFTTRDTPEWLSGWDYTPPDYSEVTNSPEAWFNKRGSGRLVNYNLFIWNNQKIAIYRKSTYCDEANSIMKRKKNSARYEFGDWKTKIIAPQNSKAHSVAQKLLGGEYPLIVSRICSDIGPSPKCMGDPKCNRWWQLGSKPKLLLIQANNSPRGLPAIFGYMLERYPRLLILRCDALNVADEFSHIFFYRNGVMKVGRYVTEEERMDDGVGGSITFYTRDLYRLDIKDQLVVREWEK